MTGSEARTEQWAKLSARIHQVAEVRNHIAHSRLRSTPTPEFYRSRASVVRVTDRNLFQTELFKWSKRGKEVIWTEKALKKELTRAEFLLRDVYAFMGELQGQTPQPDT